MAERRFIFIDPEEGANFSDTVDSHIYTEKEIKKYINEYIKNETIFKYMPYGFCFEIVNDCLIHYEEYDYIEF